MLNKTDLSRADLNLLVVFEAVLEERNVGRAAARLHLTPSAVSHGLGRLRRLLNDPLFLKTPKGVVPTERAMGLSQPIDEILKGVRNVVSMAEPFDPATSRRRFTLGAPDGASAVILPELLARLRQMAPGIDLSLRQVLPSPGDISPERAWRSVFAELEGRELDIAVIPYGEAPVRFHLRPLYDEAFVIAGRNGHPFTRDPDLKRYCVAEHLVVSLAGDPHGFVDELLAARGLSRRIALTVPNFMQALPVLAETDLIAALPGRFVALHGKRFGISGVDPPLPLTKFRLNAVVQKAALADQGIAWLLDQLPSFGAYPLPRSRKPGRKRSAV
jgi:DNA-binding transcriptional LysR family regulator